MARKYFWGHVDGFSISFADLMGGDGPAFRQDCEAAGYPLYVWTVNDRDEMIQATQWKCAAILTDNTSLYRKLQEEMANDFDLVTKSMKWFFAFRKWCDLSPVLDFFYISLPFIGTTGAFVM